MAIVSFRTSEAITAGDAVYVSETGLAVKASALELSQASVAGVAIDTGAPGSLIRVNTDAVYTSSSTFIPGEVQYLSVSTSGAYEPYEVISSGIALTSYAGFYLTPIGRALTTSKIDIEIGRPTFVENPTSVFLLEDTNVPFIDAILQEDGSTIKLESAA